MLTDEAMCVEQPRTLFHGGALEMNRLNGGHQKRFSTRRFQVIIARPLK